MTDPSTERERLLAFSFANADLLLELDAAFSITFASGALRHLTGRAESELLGASLLSLIDAPDEVLVLRLLGQLAPNARLPLVATALTSSTGEPVPINLSGYRLDSAAPRYFITVAARERSAQEACRRSDPETGLLASDDFVAAAASAQSKIANSKVTMIELSGLDRLEARLDASRFKDMLRKSGAALLAASIDNSVAGRFGPNKLGVVHRQGEDPARAARQIQALAKSADPNGVGLDLDQWTLPLNGSGMSPDQVSQVLRYAVCRFAETRLEEFRPSSMNDLMRSLVAETVQKVSTVRDTIESGSVGVAYQPIVALSDRRIHHWEALCRPGNETSAGGILEFAERFGLAGEFDLLVCAKVLDQLHQAAAKDLKPSIAINLSATSLENDVFLQALELLLATHTSLRGQILIEVTESTRITDLARADNVLQSLRKKGHKICLDDFGAGAAAFPYIQSLTVDFVKVDGAYVRRMLEDKRDAAILRSIVQLCADLDVGTVAEMIETEAQAGKLKELGIAFGQGYLFGRPRKDECFEAVRPPKLNLRRKGVVETWQ
ncbi:MAG: EAL domain-containing protein [Alphaproteobacteria bacterium]